MKTDYFSIPEPCSEDWNKMTPTKQGAFCAVCSKEVLDCSTLITNKIKDAITAKKDPCVRILKSQIDDLNLIEWFNHLSLRKQLKYLFLFTYLMVFSSNGLSQENDSTLFQPQYIEIDSVDEQNLKKELIADAPELEDEISNIELVLFQYIPYSEINSEEIITMGGWGAIYNQGFLGNVSINSNIELIHVVYGGIIEDEKENLLLEQSNYIALNESKYTFFIEEDVLIFNTNALTEEKLILIVKQKVTNQTVFYMPLLIPVGQREIKFPLAEYENGKYIIELRRQLEREAIEIMYW